MRRMIVWATLVILGPILSAAARAQNSAALGPELTSWVVYYAEDVAPEVLGRFELVVLDPDRHPSLLPRGVDRPVYLSYLSLGEAEPHRAYFESVKDAPWLVGQNPNWRAWMVDLRAPEWRRLILRELIPAILAQGFDGLFLDTLDTAVHLEEQVDPERFAGMKDSLVDLINEIGQAFPEAYLCLNRGLPLWPRLASLAEAVVVEDFSTSYDFETETYLLQPEEVVQEHLHRIASLKAAAPNIAVLTLDYVAPNDYRAARRAIERARQAGLTPYVSDIDLDEVYLYTLRR